MSCPAEFPSPSVKSSPPMAFVILSHANPDQTLRLISTLNRMYDYPPIALHHDLSQSALETSKLPPNVRLVRPFIRTGWGKISVVRALLAALELLYTDEGPDWFCLLSGADYPAARAEAVLKELELANCDAFLDVHQLGATPPQAHLVGTWNPSLDHLETLGQYRTKDRFYNKAQLWIPLIRSRPRLRLGRHTLYLPFNGSSPYSEEFGLWWGDHWFTANRRAAGVLLERTSDHCRLERHLKRRTFPEETYYQTILCNSPGLTICRDNRRFASWRGGAHPITLTDADVPAILTSGAHFARKFAPNSPALDALDRALIPEAPPVFRSDMDEADRRFAVKQLALEGRVVADSLGPA